MPLLVPLPKRKPDSHKGDYGHVFVVGGSCGLSGAVCLCAKAALRIGAGLVTVGVPRSLNTIFEIKLTEEMSLPLADTKEQSLSLKSFPAIREFAKKADVIALGCGSSRHISTKKLLLKVICEIDKTQVVDADAINALAGNITLLEKRITGNLILTPHLGEFSRLVKKDISSIKKKRKELAKDFALRYNLILVLKGNNTIVTNGKDCFHNITGNSGMATAGCGDVLTGIISGLIGQGIGCFDAAKLGVYVHGLAADYAVSIKSQFCLIASDIIEYLPKAVSKLKNRPPR
ncbi:MAG: NAD(P)H-hydrate dehydratase [Candidatus Omnitrophota bacterium]